MPSRPGVHPWAQRNCCRRLGARLGHAHVRRLRLAGVADRDRARLGLRNHAPGNRPRRRSRRSALLASDRADTHHGYVRSGRRATVRVAWHDGLRSHEKTLQRSFRIGRDAACEIHLDDPMISRQHVEVSHVDGLWWIRDLGSRNGTLVDGRARYARAASGALRGAALRHRAGAAGSTSGPARKQRRSPRRG